MVSPRPGKMGYRLFPPSKLLYGYLVLTLLPSHCESFSFAPKEINTGGCGLFALFRPRLARGTLPREVVYRS